ncbi:MAG: response regulator [PVC group bacterium]|nr:response regulator [PVC group bacterium]
MPKKILVVDDEVHVLKLLESRLRANGYEVITASDGEEGLQKVSSENPDLIILDVVMPKMDGYTFVRKIKYDTSIRTIPIIILTAKNELKELFELEGAKDYIVKPFKTEELLTKVKENLGERI